MEAMLVHHFQRGSDARETTKQEVIMSEPTTFLQHPTRPGVPAVVFERTNAKGLFAEPPGARIAIGPPVFMGSSEGALIHITTTEADEIEEISHVFVPFINEWSDKRVTEEVMAVSSSLYWSWLRARPATGKGAIDFPGKYTRQAYRLWNVRVFRVVGSLTHTSVVDVIAPTMRVAIALAADACDVSFDSALECTAEDDTDQFSKYYYETRDIPSWLPAWKGIPRSYGATEFDLTNAEWCEYAPEPMVINVDE
jgi:hypothetical protein